jgi:hypothetical protein
MDDIIERIQAAKEQQPLADVFDDWLTGEVTCGGLGSM